MHDHKYMDPQKLSQLDPKLREAYQRVMGTSSPQVQPVQAQTPPPPIPPTPEPAPVPQPESTPAIAEPPVTPVEPPIQPPITPPTEPSQPVSEPQPAIPTISTEPAPAPAQASIPSQPPTQPSNFVQMNSEVAKAPASPNFAVPQAPTQTVVLKKKNHLTPALIVIAALIFLAVYTIFWTKIFNLKLPFLP